MKWVNNPAILKWTLFKIRVLYYKVNFQTVIFLEIEIQLFQHWDKTKNVT